MRIRLLVVLKFMFSGWLLVLMKVLILLLVFRCIMWLLVRLV